MNAPRRLPLMVQAQLQSLLFLSSNDPHQVQPVGQTRPRNLLLPLLNARRQFQPPRPADLAPADLAPIEDDTATYTRGSRFVPLDTPIFLTAEEGAYLPDDDLVLGLEWMGEARAYPVRMVTYHHIVNDVVAGRPILITY